MINAQTENDSVCAMSAHSTNLQAVAGACSCRRFGHIGVFVLPSWLSEAASRAGTQRQVSSDERPEGPGARGQGPETKGQRSKTATTTQGKARQGREDKAWTP